MNIRVLTAADAMNYRILRIQALTLNPESFLTTYEDYVSRPIEQTAVQLAQTDHHFTLGAFSADQQLLATATLVREKNVKILHIASIQAMFVAPEFRRNGIGRAVLTDLIKRARQLAGLEQLKLSVVKDNVAAVALYESVGFRAYGFERRALKVDERYWDEIHMVLFLDEEDERSLEKPDY